MSASDREALSLRLRAAQTFISRELVADLARASEGRGLLLQHLAQMREKKIEGGVLVALGALSLHDILAPAPGREPISLASVPRTLEAAVRSGKLIEPRRVVAARALRDRGDVWVRSRPPTFVDGLEKLEVATSPGGVAALLPEDTVQNEAPKTGRNDPCPCGSGKKFKKCCESAPKDGPPPLGPILKASRWSEEIYALAPDRQLAVVGEPIFREHLAILVDAERLKQPPRDDPYLALAVLARVLQSRSSPAWARELALELISGPGHAALCRGGVGAWLIETSGPPPAGLELAPRVAAALAQGPLTLEGAVACGLALTDVGAHAAALAVTSRIDSHATEPRLAFVQALAHFASEDPSRARAPLEALERGARFPESDVLRAAAREVLDSLDDPPYVAEEDSAPDEEPAPQEAAPGRPVALLVREIHAIHERETPPPGSRKPVTSAANATSTAPVSSPSATPTSPTPASPAPGRLPRSAPLVDDTLGAEVAALRAEGAIVLETARRESDRARREHEEARTALRALERDLEKARERADWAKRALTRNELGLAAAERETPRLEAAAIQRVLALAEERLRERVRDHWRRVEEIAVPIVAALLPESTLLVVPVKAKEYLAGTLEPDLAVLAHACVATASDVARQADQPEESVGLAEVMGFLAIRGAAPLARYRERSELWALALDDAWGRLAIGGTTRLAPVVAQLPSEAARALSDQAALLEPAARGAHENGEDPDDAIPIERAAKRLGLSPFEVARALGARALWDASGVVAPGALATLRLLIDRSALDRSSADGDHDSSDGHDGFDGTHDVLAGDPLEEDEHPGRRALRIVLRRLVRLGKIGASHTRVDNALRGAPPHLRGTMKHAVDALLTLGVFRGKPTLNGLHISIEPTRIREIDQFVLTGEYPWPRVATIITS